MSIINVENLTVCYNRVIALEDVDLKVHKPSINIIIGPNGAGKTTLLKTLIGFINPIKGKVEVLGLNPFKSKVEVRKFIGYIPQMDKISNSVPVKVLDVILMGISVKKDWPRIIFKVDFEEVRNLTKFLGIEDILTKTFNKLSGGERQKVLLARALISKPKIVILDEPFNGIDIVSIQLIMEKLKELKDKGTTILIATHYMDLLLNLVDNILVLNKRVIAFGKVKDVLEKEIVFRAYSENRNIGKWNMGIYM